MQFPGYFLRLWRPSEIIPSYNNPFSVFSSKQNLERVYVSAFVLLLFPREFRDGSSNIRSTGMSALPSSSWDRKITKDLFLDLKIPAIPSGRYSGTIDVLQGSMGGTWEWFREHNEGRYTTSKLTVGIKDDFVQHVCSHQNRRIGKKLYDYPFPKQIYFHFEQRQFLLITTC